MAPIDMIIQETLQVLSSPAWSGVGVIVSSALSLIAFHHAHQSNSQQAHGLPLKKIKFS